MKRFLYILSILTLLVGCRDMTVSDDPTLSLSFSKDTLSFDTVFSSIGSSTLRLMIYNPNANALRINEIWLDDGRYFRVNIDGETSLDRLSDIELHGGDSLFVFVRVLVDPQNEDAPVLIEDALRFAFNGKVQQVVLEAYGQDVHLIRTPHHRTDTASCTFHADKPYLIYDTLVVANRLIISPGAQLYFHTGASLYALGSVDARGTLDDPILLRGDRRDRLFDSVPYIYASGLWDGFYLMSDAASLMPPQYHLDHVEIISGNVGLYCQSERTDRLPTLTLTNSRIHNHARYGLVLQHVNASVANTEISNCASYCVYLSGGKHRFVHTTIASYFRSTNLNIQSTDREDVAAVYIDNLSKTDPQTDASFLNSILTGVRSNQLVVATPITRYYPGTFLGNYLKTDTLRIPNASGNTYYTAEADTVPLFRNTFYSSHGYRYYDFRLDSLSPAIGIADSLTALEYPQDRVGCTRLDPATRPDAGCYQHTDYQ